MTKFYAGILEGTVGICFSSEDEPIKHPGFLYFPKIKILDYIKVNSESRGSSKFQDSVVIDLKTGMWQLGDGFPNNSLAIRAFDLETLEGEDEDSAKLFFKIYYNNLERRNDHD